MFQSERLLEGGSKLLPGVESKLLLGVGRKLLLEVESGEEVEVVLTV